MKPVVWALAGAALFTGCGYVSAPLAPTLDIPSRIIDLRAAETGENIEVAFTLPALTTEGMALKNVKSVELLVAVAGGVRSTIEVPESHVISARDWIDKVVVLAVRATGPKGKASAWSNEVSLHIGPPLAQPADLRAENVERGVRLTWRGTSSRYRIFREVGEEKPERLNESDLPEYLDESTQYGTRYQYRVQAIAGDSQGSEVSDPVTVTPKDEFAPVIPAGLTVVADVNTIELVWERNTEPDFQGYNVYRSVDGGSFAKIASLIPAPTYSDHQLETGKKYRYALSAVDLTGNESQRSPAQEATAQ